MAHLAKKRHGAKRAPLDVFVCGAAAGFAASLLLSALARMLPGMDMDPKPSEGKNGKSSPPPPEDPFNPRQVREWQERAQSPAAFQGGLQKGQQRGGPPDFTPAGALTRPQAPGPEGLAEQFAFKVAAGIFDRDVSQAVRPLGVATHLTYGSAWGALFGLIHA